MVTNREEEYGQTKIDRTLCFSSLTVPIGKSQAEVWDSETVGFGVVVGRRQKTFIAEGRVGGRRRVTKPADLANPSHWAGGPHIHVSGARGGHHVGVQP